MIINPQPERCGFFFNNFAVEALYFGWKKRKNMQGSAALLRLYRKEPTTSLQYPIDKKGSGKCAAGKPAAFCMHAHFLA